jgi:uncharacterized membrane protein YhaH (DUF805 family)
MKFFSEIKQPFLKYAIFSGRASRAEYWFFALFTLLGFGVAMLIDTRIVRSDFAFATSLFATGALLPAWSLTVRRLHDINRSGWWVLANFIPVIGSLTIFGFACTSGTVGSNRFRESPGAGGNGYSEAVRID